MTGRQKFRKALAEFLDDAGIEDAPERLYLLYKVENGIRRADAGQFVRQGRGPGAHARAARAERTPRHTSIPVRCPALSHAIAEKKDPHPEAKPGHAASPLDGERPCRGLANLRSSSRATAMGWENFAPSL